MLIRTNKQTNNNESVSKKQQFWISFHSANYNSSDYRAKVYHVEIKLDVALEQTFYNDCAQE